MSRKSNEIVRVELLTVLIKYLETHKRLVIPQLGAFLVKEPGVSIVFSELMKRDDGVLRSLLCAEGRSEVEAAGFIDRFVFEVRHAIESGSEYRLDDFGSMKPGPNGTIIFVYRPATGCDPNGVASDVRAAGHSRQTISPETFPKQPVTPNIFTPSISAQANEMPVASKPVGKQTEFSGTSDNKMSVRPKAVSDAAPKRTIVQPFPQPTSRRVPNESDPSYKSHIDTARMAETVRTAFGNEAKDGVVPMRKRVDPTSSYDSLYDEADEDYIEHPTERRKFDRFLLVAILAVVIAVAAIAFGFWREARERQAEEEMLQLEQFDTRFE